MMEVSRFATMTVMILETYRVIQWRLIAYLAGGKPLIDAIPSFHLACQRKQTNIRLQASSPRQQNM